MNSDGNTEETAGVADQGGVRYPADLRQIRTSCGIHFGNADATVSNQEAFVYRLGIRQPTQLPKY